MSKSAFHCWLYSVWLCMWQINLPWPWKQSKTALNKYVDRFWCERKTGDGFFSLYEALLWIMDPYFSQKQCIDLIMDLFLTNTQLFTSQDVNWWTGVVWITCGLLWYFHQLVGLCLDILTAPIHCRGSIGEIWWWNDKFLQIWPQKKQTKYCLNVNFQ